MDQEKLEKLKDHLENADDWAKLEAAPGVYVVKMPGRGKFVPKLSLEIFPRKDDGKPYKKKGIFITSLEQLEVLISIFSDENLIDTMKGIMETNENIKLAPKDKSDNIVGKL